MSDNNKDKKQIRIASLVIMITILVWFLASFIGGQIGLPIRYAFLFDFAALAGFLWSIIILVRVLY